MTQQAFVKKHASQARVGWYLLACAMIVTAVIYTAGLYGGFLFDDYPNIVDNHGVQPTGPSSSELVRAALSSPSSELKRPLASLSFAINYLATGLNPFWMKLTNLVIHLINGLLVFLLAKLLIRSSIDSVDECVEATKGHEIQPSLLHLPKPDSEQQGESVSRSNVSVLVEKSVRNTGIIGALIAASWMLLPINLTGVLYVVQRMESMANVFVLLGLIGYISGRRRMLRSESTLHKPSTRHAFYKASSYLRGFLLCVSSITLLAVFGILAKETAVMLPLYALLVEWIVFHFVMTNGKRDWRILALFVLVLVVPMIIGLSWLLPGILDPAAWTTRDFTLRTRLLSEARIVTDYVRWTLLPSPDALSFYHDDFRQSTGLLTPWTTLASIGFLAALIALIIYTRRRIPLVALGLALFLGCQLLTGTIVPLELIYEHRNYFASFGLMLAVIPLLAVPRSSTFSIPRQTLLAGLLLCWGGLTAMTAYAWGDPLRLAQDLAARAPQSPRAEYELGRTYIIYSHYDPASPFTKLAYAPLERAAALPEASILPEQALIFMNARMHLPLKDAWWDSIVAKLKARKSTVQDESSLGALTQCAREAHCDLPRERMIQAYLAALSHPDPSARLLAMYGDYAWNSLDDHVLGESMTAQAVREAPRESAYRITLVRMLAAQGKIDAARAALNDLELLNIGGSLDTSMRELRGLPGLQ